MDIEGAEILALEGMKRTLAFKKQMVLFVECCPSKLAKANATVEELIERLQKYDFNVKVINEQERRLEVANATTILRVLEATNERAVNLYCSRRPK